MKNNHEESKVRLLHILQAINSIQQYTEGESKTSFCKNQLLQDAVMMQFVIIGEAVAHVEQEKLDLYSYPWYKVKSFRNMIAHEYFNIKMSAVWMITQKEVKELRTVVSLMLKQEF